MPLSWAAERFAFLVSRRDRAPEKRKVGGSTPPLTIPSEQRKRPDRDTVGALSWSLGLSFGLICRCAIPVDAGHLSSGSRATVCGRGSGRCATVVLLGARHSVLV